MLDQAEALSELWHLYHTQDVTKMEALFNALVSEVDLDDLDRCIDEAWEE